jgi:Sugar kinases, ribokinase family
MSRTLICGSLAYDIISVFPDRFARHLLPDHMHRLSVSFNVSSLRREWGGCAGNIAYTLKKIGGTPVVMATLGGEDGKAYEERLQKLDIAQDGVKLIPGMYTAQATIMTDLDDNQITSFFPGAMNESHQLHVADVNDIALGIVSPDGKEGMLQHARQFHQAGIPFILDPGQAMPMFGKEELLEMVTFADVIALNDYEAELLCKKTELPQKEIAQKVRAMIITYGGRGSQIITAHESITIPAVKPDAETDPTGCGDAYRAGLLYGIAQNWPWRKTGQLAALLGSIKMASPGPQNHDIDREKLTQRYFDAFKEELWS